MKHNKMKISKTKLNVSVIREITALLVLTITIVIILPQAGRL